MTSIGEKVFYNCSSLTSITFPNSVTTIGSSAFYGCSGLTSITIGNSVTSIGSSAFANCTKLTNVTLNSNKIVSVNRTYNSSLKTIFGEQVINYIIGDNITNIGDYAFYYCEYITSITIPNSLTSIGGYAFNGCSGLTSITIPGGVTTIGNSAFSGCSNLTDVKVSVTDLSAFCNNKVVGLIASNIKKSVCLIDKDGKEIKEYAIPEDVTSIGEKVFYNCSGVTSITIGNSVTTIGNSAFYNCSGLTSITIPSGVTTIGSSAFQNCSGLTSVTIPNSVTNIGSEAFRNCSGLTFITIPNNVTNIGSSAFYDCRGLTSVTIPSSVTSIGSNAFVNCYKLENITLNSNSIVSANRSSNSSLVYIFGKYVNNLIIGNDVTSIGAYAFYNCEFLSSITFSNSVTSIGAYAFGNCKYLSSIILPDNVTSISNYAFRSSTKFYTKHKTWTLFNLWNGKYNNIYEQETSKSLAPPYLSCPSRTQTSFAIEINNMYSEYTYEYNGEEVTSSSIEVKNLYPDYSGTQYVYVKFGEMSYRCESSFFTQSISPSINVTSITASSLSAKGTYTEGNAEIAEITIKLNNKIIEGNNIYVTGLNPNTSYQATYTITIKYGENLQYTRDYTKTYNMKTESLTLTTQQPKVVSLGNVIVAAESNIDDEEKNVGFEWRRTDWTDDFASNTGTANMFEGTMEGYIRNLNTEKLWKFRPYYLADNGTYYYGDWIGVDPTNTSFFEPTVHTYDKIEVNGNTALIKGYALGGSDDVIVQGFKYWKNAGGTSSRVSATDIPSTAKTIEASGTVMEANLPDLDYDSSYSYVAFATTSTGTYYGEIKTFDTGNNPTGINTIKIDNTSTEDVHEIARYNMQGRRIETPEKGINIVKMSDGTTRKIFVK